MVESYQCVTVRNAKFKTQIHNVNLAYALYCMQGLKFTNSLHQYLCCLPNLYLTKSDVKTCQNA